MTPEDAAAFDALAESGLVVRIVMDSQWRVSVCDARADGFGADDSFHGAAAASLQAYAESIPERERLQRERAMRDLALHEECAARLRAELGVKHGE